MLGPSWASITRRQRARQATQRRRERIGTKRGSTFISARGRRRTRPASAPTTRRRSKSFREYGKLLDPPVETVRIPFEGKEIVGYLRLPHGVTRAPVVISIGGLDEFKEYGVEHGSTALTDAGLGFLGLDMPGTGEAAVPMEVGSERMIDAVITYLGTRTGVDPQRIAVMGASAGGYWSALAGYTERQRLRAVVVRGGPIHGYFQADWQRKSWGTSEYLFGLKEARMFVYGFKEGEDDAFLKRLATFSLETRGILKSAVSADAGGEWREGKPSPDCRPLSPAAHRHPEIRLGQS